MSLLVKISARIGWVAAFVLLSLPIWGIENVLPVYLETTSNTLSLVMKRYESKAIHLGKQLHRIHSFGEIYNQSGVVVIDNGEIPIDQSSFLQPINFEHIDSEGFTFKWNTSHTTLYILSNDSIGAQYGLIEVLDHWLAHGSLQAISEKTVNPFLEYRILKYNLPWSPYRDNPATNVHYGASRDLVFWERFLDMMVDNRFNVLSLWNNHPFPYMIRSESYPHATPFSDAELADWKQFWTSLFHMAKQRGIQTFVINWNIVVSPAFAEAYGAQEYNDRSEMVEAYTRESVRQLIDEYPDLTGIGVTLADWMGNFPDSMSPQEREDWIARTFVEGMKTASRPVKFLHRSVLAGDPMAMRALIDEAELEEPALVEIKFNWSHGHSTPDLAITHDFHSGELDSRFWDPLPENYRIQWMVRNEDFFILRWGQANFIRQHILQNKMDAVNGYFIGSEGYIPAVDYASLPTPDRTWQYAFEKQWLFYSLWGRLLYDPHAPDSIFEDQLALRFGKEVANSAFHAYQLASQTPLRLASFYRATWDYTLYSEGFIAAEPANRDAFFDRNSPFISIAEWIAHETLDTNLMSISSYVSQTLGLQAKSEQISPLVFAQTVENDAREAIARIDSIRDKALLYRNGLGSELDDMATWARLGLYMAEKIRAGVALETFRLTGDESERIAAVRFLQQGLEHWDAIVALNEHRYQPVPHVASEYYGEEFTEFSWGLLRPEVARDIQIVKEFKTNGKQTN